MSPKQIAARLVERFGAAITASLPEDKHPRIHTTAEHWRAMAEFLRNDPELAFDWLACLSGVDYPEQKQLCAVYELRSTRHEHWFAVKVFVDRDRPVIPSVSDLWPAAEWHEREAYDLLGIRFEGHPDLRRILLPEDWEGHPLRKDYVYPQFYHGIPLEGAREDAAEGTGEKRSGE